MEALSLLVSRLAMNHQLPRGNRIAAEQPRSCTLSHLPHVLITEKRFNNKRGLNETVFDDPDADGNQNVVSSLFACIVGARRIPGLRLLDYEVIAKR